MFFPPSDDEVRCATDHAQVAVVVDLDDVAHEHPAVVGQQLLVGVVIAPVAEAGGGAPARRLAPMLPGGHVGVGLGVEQAHLHLVDQAAGGGEAMRAVVVDGGVAEGAGLVGAVELEDRGAGGVLEGGGLVEGHRLTAGEHGAQRAEITRPFSLGVEQHDELRAHAAQHGDPLPFDEVEGGVGVEALHHQRRAAEDRGGEVGRPQTEPERCRHRPEEHLVVGEGAGPRRQRVEVEPAVLGVHHALGQPGGARGGVEEEEGIGVAPHQLDLGAGVAGCAAEPRRRPPHHRRRPGPGG